MISESKFRNNKRLEDLSVGRNNNLDIIRFFCAVLVIYSHSLPLSYGENISKIVQLTRGELTWGSLAVSVFFFLSGFLVSKSLLRVKKGKDYFKQRCIRILPPLMFVSLVMALIAGPILTSYPLQEYLLNGKTYKYLLNGILILQYNLPGVFTNNVYDATVNGALWTLPVEFGCYVLLFFMYKFGFLQKKKFYYSVPILILGCVFLWFISSRIPVAEAVILPMTMFYVGAAIYIYRDKIFLNGVLAVIFAILMICCSIWINAKIAVVLFFPYIILFLAYGTKLKFSNFSKHGEYSYGIYLWGCPIQQTICMLFGGSMDYRINFIISAILAIGMGIVTYLLVDKPINHYIKK